MILEFPMRGLSIVVDLKLNYNLVFTIINLYFTFLENYIELCAKIMSKLFELVMIFSC